MMKNLWILGGGLGLVNLDTFNVEGPVQSQKQAMPLLPDILDFNQNLMDFYWPKGIQ